MSLKAASQATLLASVLILPAVLFDRFSPEKAVSQEALGLGSFGLTEQKMAIDQARRNGQPTYSYKTNFLPGIGFMINAKEYQAELEGQMAPSQRTTD